ncbi:hypothetical protein P3G55_21670, partial [Leptospira sp. 96542]|nr:hypothetical protein [Leptospira sp. 96542]
MQILFLQRFDLLKFRVSSVAWPVLTALLVACLAAGASTASAQFRVEVSGVGLTQVPFSIVPFKGEAGVPQKVSAIVLADLERSGQFRNVALKADGLDEGARPDLGAWRQAGSDALIAGSVTRMADGRYDVRFRLWDVVAGKDLGGQSFLVTAADLRLSAWHKQKMALIPSGQDNPWSFDIRLHSCFGG